MAGKVRYVVPILLCAVVWAAFTLLTPEEKAHGADGPDIIFLVVETLRADRIQAWGGPRHTMPNLEDIAASGIRFDRAISAAPWTLPSVTSILTGLSPSAHGVSRYEDVLSPDLYTLPERLKDFGYETAFFGVNSLFEADRGIKQGFDTYYGIDEIPGTQLLAELDGFLRHRENAKPLFLYVHLFEPHCRYQAPDYMQDMYWPPPPALVTGAKITDAQFRTMHECFQLHRRSGEAIYDIDYYLSAYDAELRYADHLLGIVVERLKMQELFDNALLVVTGDHGEEFWEKGDFGHGRTLHKAAVHVPLVVKPPGRTAPQTIAVPISLLNLMPTALKAAGAPMKAPIQGEDLGPIWTSDSPSILKSAVFTETDYEEKSKRAIYYNSKKMVISLTGEKTTYGSTDGRQNEDLEATPGALDSDLKKRLRLHKEKSATIAKTLDITTHPLSPEDIENLKRLGYLE